MTVLPDEILATLNETMYVPRIWIRFSSGVVFNMDNVERVVFKVENDKVAGAQVRFMSAVTENLGQGEASELHGWLQENAELLNE